MERGKGYYYGERVNGVYGEEERDIWRGRKGCMERGKGMYGEGVNGVHGEGKGIYGEGERDVWKEGKGCMEKW